MLEEYAQLVDTLERQGEASSADTCGLTVVLSQLIQHIQPVTGVMIEVMQDRKFEECNALCQGDHTVSEYAHQYSRLHAIVEIHYHLDSLY